jgi:hypothetical protein
MRPGAATSVERLIGVEAATMPGMNLTAIEAKPFVPASDFDRSKEFYLAAGFQIPWSSEDLAFVRHGKTAFLLQAFDQPAFIRNFQMHLLVENVDDWHSHLKAIGIEERFEVRMGEPQDQPWAMRDFTVFDPSGVLWRIAQNLPRSGNS